MIISKLFKCLEKDCSLLYAYLRDLIRNSILNFTDKIYADILRLGKNKLKFAPVSSYILLELC